ncbi:MAG: hypothetical protein HOP18_07385 [Deltaproteobacteria bacterium]|nr:hypothetical protein [Deltaproteobacteria bacterium]
MFVQRGLVTFMCGMFVVVSGCTHSTRYNPSYLAAANPSAVEPTAGKGLLYTRAEDDHAHSYRHCRVAFGQREKRAAVTVV